MSVYSDTARNSFLAGFFGDDNVVGATLYIGLSETEPTYSAGSLTGITEPTTGGYARVAVSNTSTNWTIADGECVNANVIQFPQATADWDVDFSYAVVFDAASGGNALCASGALVDAPVTMLTDDITQFNAETLVFTHNN